MPLLVLGKVGRVKVPAPAGAILPVRNPPAAMSELQARNRETYAVEAISTSPRSSVYVAAGDLDTQSPLCNVSVLPVGASIDRVRSEVERREGVIPEAIGPKNLRFPPAAPRGSFEVAAAGDCTSAFNFKSLEELSLDLVATLQDVQTRTSAVKESATGNDNLLSANGSTDLNEINDERTESYEGRQSLDHSV